MTHITKNSPSADTCTAESGAHSQRLAAIRQEIDHVDSQLLALLNQRASLSLEVGRIKNDALEAATPGAYSGVVFQPLREREVLEALEQHNPGPLPQKHLRSIWREIFSSSRTLQSPQKVAYLGPEGTFSYFAGVEYLGHSANLQPCRDLHDVFRAVHDHQCDLGVVPLENSLQGSVGQSFDLFHKFPVHIQAELYSRISHCLLTTATALSQIQRVYSHPQPLAQCDAWLRANLPGINLIPVESTAAAATRAAQEEGAAAIGHASLATLLPLNTLAQAIEDEPSNWTRFVIVGPISTRSTTEGCPSLGSGANAVSSEKLAVAPKKLASDVSSATSLANKTSLLFTLPDKPGALAAVLDTLAKHNINMRKLESRPLKGESWKYVFFVDVEADLEHPSYADITETLRGLCATFRILGSYAAGAHLL